MFLIRPANPGDREPLGRMGAALMRQHHAADERRFLTVDHPEHGYGRYLVSHLDDPGTLVLVAEREGEVIGYLYADVEDTSWRDLRGPCGFVHDVFVAEGARGSGAGRALMRTAIEWIRSHDREQVVLSTKTGNDRARRLFAELGFRATMVEMTLDLPAVNPPGKGSDA
jgi:GNAT superfamily N-acetyltransferase